MSAHPTAWGFWRTFRPGRLCGPGISGRRARRSPLDETAQARARPRPGGRRPAWREQGWQARDLACVVVAEGRAATRDGHRAHDRQTSPYPPDAPARQSTTSRQRRQRLPGASSWKVSPTPRRSCVRAPFVLPGDSGVNRRLHPSLRRLSGRRSPPGRGDRPHYCEVAREAAAELPFVEDEETGTRG